MTKFFKGSVALSVLLAGFAFNGFADLTPPESKEVLASIARVKLVQEKGDEVNVKALALLKRLTDREEEKCRKGDKDLVDLREALKAKGLSDNEIDAGKIIEKKQN
jgi:hypothetical protein